jgi:NTE family protein
MSQFRNLVFEGGGVKGIAYAGALEVLEKENILPDIKRGAGTSAGAITAALLALGAKSADIADIVGHTSFRKFMDDSFGMVRDTKRLLTEYGWYKGDAFTDWMKKLIYNFTWDSNLTFRQLRDLVPKDPRKYRDLYVVGTNLRMQIPQVFSADETPDMPIWLGVRISMSIPLFFAAVRQEEGIYVDGGVTWNYPIDLFDDKKYLDPESKAFKIPDYPTKYDENQVYNKETLGFRVDTKDEIKAEKESWRRPPAKIDNLLDYAGVLLGFIMDMANKAHLHKNDWHRTAFIDAGGVRTTEFDLPDSKVEMLLESGRKGVREYLSWFNDPNAKETPLNRI